MVLSHLPPLTLEKALAATHLLRWTWAWDPLDPPHTGAATFISVLAKHSRWRGCRRRVQTRYSRALAPQIGSHFMSRSSSPWYRRSDGMLPCAVPKRHWAFPLPATPRPRCARASTPTSPTLFGVSGDRLWARRGEREKWGVAAVGS
jgi:hypothetical protein